jgi:hypothetical protein
MKTIIFVLVFLITITAPAGIPLAAQKGVATSEMARKLQIWLLNIEAVIADDDISFKTGNDDTSYSFQSQPLSALDFPEKGLSFLPRTGIPVIGAAPQIGLLYLSEITPSDGSTNWRLSDIITRFFLTPKANSKWKWGVGPQFSWKTRTEDKVDELGMGVEGVDTANNSSISTGWKANSKNTWTVPLGAMVGRTVDMGNGYGLDLSIGPYWNVIKPAGGADWFLKFGLTLLFP